MLDYIWGQKKQNDLVSESKEFTTWIKEKEGDAQSLKLDIIGNESITVGSDVTDNYVENNVSYQDHITRKPLIYTLEGEIGEVTYYNKDASNSVVEGLTTKLVPITTFLPSVSKKMYSVMNKTTKLLNLVDSIDNFVTRWSKLFTNEGNDLQSNAFCYLLSLWYIRKPITIQTPWRKLSGYVITNIEFNQPRETRDKTKIKISFKEFREVSKMTSKFDPNKLFGRAQAQKSNLQDLGQTTGSTVTNQMCKANQWCPDLSYGDIW